MSMDHAALQDFLRANKGGWQYVAKSVDDYLLARLGIRCALWSGFEMATQAIEKLLKGYILFRDSRLTEQSLKSLARNSNGKMLHHDIDHWVVIACEKGLLLDGRSRLAASRVSQYYSRRYPSTDHLINQLSTGEIDDLDLLYFAIWQNFESINVDYFYVSGFCRSIYVHLSLSSEGRMPIDTAWSAFADGNQTYETHRSSLTAGAAARLKPESYAARFLAGEDMEH